jgi:hypothetical protein
LIARNWPKTLSLFRTLRAILRISIPCWLITSPNCVILKIIYLKCEKRPNKILQEIFTWHSLQPSPESFSKLKTVKSFTSASHPQLNKETYPKSNLKPINNPNLLDPHKKLLQTTWAAANGLTMITSNSKSFSYNMDMADGNRSKGHRLRLAAGWETSLWVKLKPMLAVS